MKKFTIFTVILTVVVIVMMAELAVNQYITDGTKPSDEISSQFRLPEGIDAADSIATNVLGSDSASSGGTVTGFPDPVESSSSDSFPDAFEEGTAIIPDLASEEISVAGDNVLGSELLEVPTGDDSSEASAISDFEDVDFTTNQISVFIRNEHVKSAGFSNAFLEDQDHQGYLFKTVYIDDFFDVDVQKVAVRTNDKYLAKVYVFDVGIQSDVHETFQLLKMRASTSTDIQINETNDFADGSFYMNDPKREKTAFLVVRIGKYIYAFSYPKDYHPQIKNLIQLLVWELG